MVEIYTTLFLGIPLSAMCFMILEIVFLWIEGKMS